MKRNNLKKTLRSAVGLAMMIFLSALYLTMPSQAYALTDDDCAALLNDCAVNQNAGSCGVWYCFCLNPQPEGCPPIMN